MCKYIIYGFQLNCINARKLFNTLITLDCKQLFIDLSKIMIEHEKELSEQEKKEEENITNNTSCQCHNGEKCIHLNYSYPFTCCNARKLFRAFTTQQGQYIYATISALICYNEFIKIESQQSHIEECRYFTSKTGCKYGEKCRYSHKTSSTVSIVSTSN